MHRPAILIIFLPVISEKDDSFFPHVLLFAQLVPPVGSGEGDGMGLEIKFLSWQEVDLYLCLRE